MGATLEPVGNVRDLARDGFSREDKKKIDDGDELAQLTLEVKEAVSFGGDVQLYRISGEVASDRVYYPMLLSGAREVSMSRSNAIEELALLLAFSEADADASLLLYSFQIREPAQWAWPKGATSLESVHSNSGRQAELRMGYFYHEVLHSIDSRSRTGFLAWLLQSVDVLEVSIRGGPAESASHVRVTLKDG